MAWKHAVVDIATLFGAARAIGKHHVSVRQQQWTVYTKTSSVIRAGQRVPESPTIIREQEHEPSGNVWYSEKNAAQSSAGQTEELNKEERIHDDSSATSSAQLSSLQGEYMPHDRNVLRHDTGRSVHSTTEINSQEQVLQPSDLDATRNFAQDGQQHASPPTASETVEQQKAREDILAALNAEQAGPSTQQPSEIERGVTPSETETEVYEMRQSRVPASRLGRLWQYGGLATSMAFGAVGESLRSIGGSSDGRVMLSDANINRLVARLSRMRGAALKIGQMMSFQGAFANLLHSANPSV